MRRHLLKWDGARLCARERLMRVRSLAKAMGMERPSPTRAKGLFSWFKMCLAAWLALLLLGLGLGQPPRYWVMVELPNNCRNTCGIGVDVYLRGVRASEICGLYSGDCTREPRCFLIEFFQDDPNEPVPSIIIKWRGLYEPGGNGCIDFGEWVRIGWCMSGRVVPPTRIDLIGSDGRPIRCFPPYDPTELVTPEVILCHKYAPRCYDACRDLRTCVLQIGWGRIHSSEGWYAINGVKKGVFNQPYTLAELNRDNGALMSQLQDHPHGAFLSIPPGGSISLSLPEDVPECTYLVLYYEIPPPAEGDEQPIRVMVQSLVENPLLGDVNGDGFVDDADLLTVLFNFGTGGCGGQ